MVNGEDMKVTILSCNLWLADKWLIMDMQSQSKVYT
jgi:hypothetical protein